MSEYDKGIEDYEAINQEYIDLFAEDLKKKGLKQSTIDRHIFNVDLYLNDFLPREGLSMEEGNGSISYFMKYFYIAKCSWSVPSNIKSTAVSIRKFYKLMVDMGKADREGYEYMVDEIKNETDSWIETCRRYNDPFDEDPFDEGDWW